MSKTALQTFFFLFLNLLWFYCFLNALTNLHFFRINSGILTSCFLFMWSDGIDMQTAQCRYTWCLWRFRVSILAVRLLELEVTTFAWVCGDMISDLHAVLASFNHEQHEWNLLISTQQQKNQIQVFHSLEPEHRLLGWSVSTINHTAGHITNCNHGWEV